jgi:ComF family protein
VECARSVGRYEGSLRGILHAFKYEGRQSLARPLAALLRAAGEPVLDGADWVIPVPLHPWRHARRGFNQSDALAQQLGIPVVRALWRMRATAPQTSLRASARRRNVQGAFALSPLMGPRSARLLEGRVLVLVDDVWTTGATLAACATVLRHAGAAQVRALTVARAPCPSAHRGSITAEGAA